MRLAVAMCLSASVSAFFKLPAFRSLSLRDFGDDPAGMCDRLGIVFRVPLFLCASPE